MMIQTADSTISERITQPAKMKLHFIAIGGSVMHNLALSLAQSGYRISGSDDEIHNPAQDRLASAGLLPEKLGWYPEKITSDLDAVILGMHARDDNPELRRAKELGIKVYSFPEFILEHSRNKQRIVVAGSHGKSTITAMIMHVLGRSGYDFDYLVGAQVKGFEFNVRLSEDAPIIVLEGDEYLASTIDPRPKFLIYDPHIVILSGISWDHINVFPTEEEYHRPFIALVQNLTKAGMLIYNKEDKIVREIVHRYTKDEYHSLHPYITPIYRVNREGLAEIKLEGKRFPIQIIGKHNAANIAAAWEACKLLAVSQEEFMGYIGEFEGASMRLQKVYEDPTTLVLRDFAHAPSKVLATVNAVSEHYKDRNVIACLELHTFSSLNKDYLRRYRNTLKKIKNKLVLVSQKTLHLKKMPTISADEIKKAFHDSGIKFVQSKIEMLTQLKPMLNKKNVILLMSSGNFENLDIKEIVG
jgi:UDP-N-acetylmuramate-alanine ligase